MLYPQRYLPPNKQTASWREDNGACPYSDCPLDTARPLHIACPYTARPLHTACPLHTDRPLHTARPLHPPVPTLPRGSQENKGSTPERMLQPDHLSPAPGHGLNTSWRPGFNKEPHWHAAHCTHSAGRGSRCAFPWAAVRGQCGAAPGSTGLYRGQYGVVPGGNTGGSTGQYRRH